jgi:hypothetical protein
MLKVPVRVMTANLILILDDILAFLTTPPLLSRYGTVAPQTQSFVLIALSLYSKSLQRLRQG